MENRRTHNFSEGKVITGLLPTGEFGAYREQDDGLIRGHGHSRLAAIADLNEQIGGEEEADRTREAATAWAFDHARDLRKHGAV